ncbi:Proteasome subunit beta type-1 [Dinochytrium kinnereticum]|nr:Proteasome subunit beta type-1 [Dinochytrium kinnereticum]
MSTGILSMPLSAPVEHRFSPYTDNGGTTLAVAGEDFCIVAADTRQSEGYSINSRFAPKAHKLSDSAVLGTGGMYADSTALVKRLQQRMEWYFYKHEKTMSAPALAQMLSTILYGKRFFPYYVWNILGGLDEEGSFLYNNWANLRVFKGKGCVFSYDPVGNFEKQHWACSGSAGHLIQPFLDNQVGRKHHAVGRGVLPSEEEALKIVKDAFAGATERDIYTGDFLELYIIRKTGVRYECIDLKKD